MRMSGRLSRIVLSSAWTFPRSPRCSSAFRRFWFALHGRPDHPNTFAGLGHVISGGRVDPIAVVDLIAVMAWGAWLVIAVAIVLEVVAWIRGRPTPRFGIAGPFQPVVRNLVRDRNTAPRHPRCAGTRRSHHHRQRRRIRACATRAAATQSLLCSDASLHANSELHRRAADALWGLAETHLKNPLRWSEIFELNHGALQPDGRRLEDPNLIIPGWTLHLPSDAVAVAAAPTGPAPTPPTFAQPIPPPTPVPPTTPTPARTRAIASVHRGEDPEAGTVAQPPARTSHRTR